MALEGEHVRSRPEAALEGRDVEALEADRLVVRQGRRGVGGRRARDVGAPRDLLPVQVGDETVVVPDLEDQPIEDRRIREREGTPDGDRHVAALHVGEHRPVVVVVVAEPRLALGPGAVVEGQARPAGRERGRALEVAPQGAVRDERRRHDLALQAVWRARRSAAERARRPVRGIVDGPVGVDEAQRMARAIAGGRPRAAVVVGEGHDARRLQVRQRDAVRVVGPRVVGQDEPLPGVVEVPLVLAEGSESVARLEGGGIACEDEVPVLPDAPDDARVIVAVGEDEPDAVGEAPAPEIEGLGDLVVKLDELELLAPALGVVHDLGDDDAEGPGEGDAERGEDHRASPRLQSRRGRDHRVVPHRCHEQLSCTQGARLSGVES